MAALKEWVICISAIIIFITAVEMILPNNSLKKYAQFVFSIILTVAIVKPIVGFISKGPDDFTEQIKKYISADDTYKTVQKEVDEDDYTNKEISISVQRLLNQRFTNKDFKVDFTGSFNREKYTLTTKEVKVGIKDHAIKKIEKINLQNDKKVDNYNDVRNYLKEILKTDDSRIKIYEME